MTSMISKETVEHISQLARIDLTDDEKKRFGKELAAILEFVEALNEVDTSSTVPMSGGTRMSNIMRKDHEGSGILEGKADELRRAARASKKSYIEVPNVFES
ncbi:MAG: hypothetical protein A2847_02670 [Candidatus Sungbacteria bacterium RIFCSPHIGHO2_01_FULL_50_25]|uniref:Aspartyl/glutamyl-tRNA(Asn/Gln) amidotransferase subunit C n=1 Tax=Candidatus Sungbacteria bacterium RIFCSPHIGHO2_01_FULL_50_25 TaxID=1802265 RepID=A0A1G2KBT5_9BACT|nr:MAG: hypothetical protein A2847_02670 [Candidatus Sungbacteria bacterium RIFCSPHIGHO2_01_FULL_50_25]